MFRRNVGGLDRILRLTLGPVLLISGILLLTGRTALGATLAVVGLLALITGIVRFCVLYIPFGISTLKSENGARPILCDCEQWMREARKADLEPGHAPGAARSR